jgi:hypothetical protein
MLCLFLFWYSSPTCVHTTNLRYNVKDGKSTGQRRRGVRPTAPSRSWQPPQASARRCSAAAPSRRRPAATAAATRPRPSCRCSSPGVSPSRVRQRSAASAAPACPGVKRSIKEATADNVASTVHNHLYTTTIVHTCVMLSGVCSLISPGVTRDHISWRLSTVRACPGRLSALDVLHHKSVLFVWRFCMGAQGA